MFCLEQSVIGSLVIHLSCLLSSYAPTKVGPLPVIHGVRAPALAGIFCEREYLKTKFSAFFVVLDYTQRIIYFPYEATSTLEKSQVFLHGSFGGILHLNGKANQPKSLSNFEVNNIDAPRATFPRGQQTGKKDPFWAGKQSSG